MMTPRIALHRFVEAECPELAGLLHDVATAAKIIAGMVARAGMDAWHGEEARPDAAGDRQRKLVVLVNETILGTCAGGGRLAGMASQELDGVYLCPDARGRGEYLLAFDPIDGSTNLDVDITVGTIFSILRRPGGAGDAAAADFFQPGSRQVCAGYALYGPSTMLVVTLGRGVHGFTLDRELGEFVLTHGDMRIAEATRELAFNAADERFWEPPVARFVDEHRTGRVGPRQADVNMRWVASLVADVHRILVRGGVFLYPRDTKQPARAGRLRLVYEAAPMAFLVEQAGGAASTGRCRLLDVTPCALHERVPVILGSRAEVDRLVRYHVEHDAGLDRPYRSPLFGSRTLYR